MGDIFCISELILFVSVLTMHGNLEQEHNNNNNNFHNNINKRAILF